MWSRIARFIAFAALFSLTAGGTAWAHHPGSGATTGLSIPGLTHGQMAVIAQYRGAILDLADRQRAQSDETFFRLRNFVELQHLYCLWGLVPGSVTDEASPFNACSHAYLSGAQALLLHMQTMPGNQTRVHALVDTIARSMLANNAALVLCQYSNAAFNTAQHISPRWRDVPSHAPSALSLLAVAGLAFGGVIGGGRLLKRIGSGRSI